MAQGTLPVTKWHVVNCAGIVGIIGYTKSNGWTCDRSDRKGRGLTPYLIHDGQRWYEAGFPIKGLGESYSEIAKLTGLGSRMVHLRWSENSVVMVIPSPRPSLLGYLEDH